MTNHPALVVALAVLLAGCGRDTTRIVTTASPYGEEGLHVTGTAVVHTAPDYAVVTVGCETMAVGARNARETNKAVMSKVLAAVKAQGVDPKDVHTVEYDLSSTYTYTDGQKRRIQWRVRNRVEVRVRDTEKVADVVDAATDAGANTISGVRYAVEDLHKVRAQARERASQIAREKAEQLAKALGGSLGRLIAVHDGGMRGWWYGGNSSGYAAQANINMQNPRAVSPPMGAGTAEAEISTGQIAVEATEEVTYELR